MITMTRKYEYQYEYGIITMIKPRATLCVFSHAKIEIASSKGVHCSVSDA